MKSNICKLLVHDIKASIFERGIRLIILILCTTLLYGFILNSEGQKQHNSSILNYMYGADYKELEETNTTNETEIDNTSLKILILINSLFLFAFIDYFKSSFNEREVFIFTRIRKEKFYLVKLFSMFLNISITYLALFAILFVFDITTNLPYMMEIGVVLLLNILSTFTILLLCNSINIFLSYKISIPIAIFSIIGTIVFNSPLIIMQHSIMARHVPYSKFDYLTNGKSFLYTTVFILIIAIATYCTLSKRICFKGECNGKFKSK